MLENPTDLETPINPEQRLERALQSIGDVALGRLKTGRVEMQPGLSERGTDVQEVLVSDNAELPSHIKQQFAMGYENPDIVIINELRDRTHGFGFGSSLAGTYNIETGEFELTLTRITKNFKDAPFPHLPRRNTWTKTKYKGINGQLQGATTQTTIDNNKGEETSIDLTDETQRLKETTVLAQYIENYLEIEAKTR